MIEGPLGTPHAGGKGQLPITGRFVLLGSSKGKDFPLKQA